MFIFRWTLNSTPHCKLSVAVEDVEHEFLEEQLLHKMAALMIDNVAPLIIMMQRNERYLDGCIYQLTEVFELGANFTLSCQFQREQKKKTRTPLGTFMAF